MRINYTGPLEPAIILLRDSEDRPDYLNSFLKYASEILSPANIRFNGDMDIPQILQEPYEPHNGPFVDIRAGDESPDAFMISVEYLREVDKNQETLEKIIATFANGEKPAFKEVSTKELSEQDDGELDPFYYTSMVAKIGRDKVSFIPIENYRQQMEIKISKGNDSTPIAQRYPVAEYDLNPWDKRIVDVRINGGKNPFSIIKAYKLAKKLKPEMLEAEIYCVGFGHHMLVNDGYDWNLGHPIIWTPETRARRERLDIESKDARKLILDYSKAHGYRKNASGIVNAFTYARNFTELGIIDPKVVAGASILKELGGIKGAVDNIHALDKAKYKIGEVIDIFSPEDTEKYMQELSEALNRYIGDFSS